MPRNFNLPGKVNFKDPRVAMRALLGTLLLANLVMAVILIKPFGGSSEDLARQQSALSAQLTQAQVRLAASKKLVEKVQSARKDGDLFLAKYFMDEATTSATILAELTKMAQEAGVQMGTANFNREPIEGSETLLMLATQVGFEGTYANLTKFINLLDKSPQFMIIESMQANAPQQQGGQRLNVTLKIDTFVKDVNAVAEARAGE
jgi:hypothetical protein